MNFKAFVFHYRKNSLKRKCEIPSLRAVYTSGEAIRVNSNHKGQAGAERELLAGKRRRKENGPATLHLLRAERILPSVF